MYLSSHCPNYLYHWSDPEDDPWGSDRASCSRTGSTEPLLRYSTRTRSAEPADRYRITQSRLSEPRERYSNVRIRSVEPSARYRLHSVEPQSLYGSSLGSGEPFLRETSEPRYLEWSDYVMRSYEKLNLPSVAYTTFHEFRRDSKKRHCRVTVFDDSWYSIHNAFAFAHFVVGQEEYSAGSSFDAYYVDFFDKRSPAVEAIRKVSRSVFEKIGVLSRRRNVVHELEPAQELPELLLDHYCDRPIEFYREEKKFSFRDLLSAKEKEDKQTQREKCAYLFRGESLEEEVTYHPTVERMEEYDPYCPVHGSRRRLAQKGNKLVTMQSFMSTVDEVEPDQLPSFVYSQDFIAKIVRKQKRAQMTGMERLRTEKVMHKIKVNLFIISLAFLFLFTAFHGLQNLQTSVNHNLGADSLAIHYVSLAISSLFVPSFMINRLGCKLTLICAMSIYVLYIMSNFLPRYYSLIPSSILAGVAGSCLWGAKCVYITECGIRYARLNIESQNTVIVRFFGYFFMIVHLGQVSGNLISAYILEAAMPKSVIEDHAQHTCGHAFPALASDLSERARQNLERPPQTAFFSVCAAYLACAIVAVMIVCMFLNALHKDVVNRTKPPSFNAEILKLTLKNFSNIKVLLLIPLTLFNGVEQAFVVGVYTKAFIGCGMGIPQIGFVMTAFGVADAVFSLVFGPLIKLFGRTPLFVFGAVINMLMIVTLIIWPLNPADGLLFYVVACVWGMADGVWNTQVNGFWVALVGRKSLELAFANYRFWESLGIAAGFVLIRLATVEHFLLFSNFFLILGMCGYFCIELFDSIQNYFKKLASVMLVARKPMPGQEPQSMQVSLISHRHGSVHTEHSMRTQV